MPLPSSGVIVVEKPSSPSVTRIKPTTSVNAINSTIYSPKDQNEQQTQIQYIEYYDVHENPLSQRQQQQQQQQHQQSTIVVDATLFHQQQQQHQKFQLGGSSGVAIGRKVHNSSSSALTATTLSSSLCTTSATILNKQNLQIQTLKAVPMPQTKYSQQQQIIQHTSHSTNSTATISNPQHHLHQQPQHVQQINLAASTSSIQHQTHQHHSQQHHQPTTTAHMIQVSEEFLEQAANNHNTGNMMISTTGEVMNQQQIFKIVSTDGSTGNMIIDATNQNANSTTTSKVLLSNLTVLSKQPSNGQAQIIANKHQQSQNVGQTINFVKAKNLYTASAVSGNIASCSKQQKFAVATANVGNYKSSSIKQGSSLNAQYLQQPNSISQQKINMTTANRSVQMLTTARVQNSASNNTTSNITSNNNSIAVISNNATPAQTMILQQPQKFITNNSTGSNKISTTTLGSSSGNVIKKSTTTGTLRMNNSHNNTSNATKLMNNLQTTPGVKTFITQSPNLQSHAQQNMNQLTTLQHPTTKSGSKSKFVKQYNNAILNSAGAVSIATLPHQQPNSQNNLQIQQQQQQHHHQQTAYINHLKSSGGATKINKISSKYAQTMNMAAQLPPGTQLHQKSIIQSQHPQQQFQTTNNNSNIKFVNAQGTIIQQQHQQIQQHTLTPQKVNNKHHHQHHLHQQPQYQNVQNFDTGDGNNVFHQSNVNASVAGLTGTTATLPISAVPGSTLLTDDIMMVNGTQMTDEISARILQSMSQKSFGNQRYHQLHQHVFQAKNTTIATPSSISINSINNNNNNNNNGNMLPPPQSSSTQNTIIQTNNNSNILLSPHEYTLYPTSAAASSSVGIANQPSQQPHLHSSPIHYNNSANPTATASSTAGSFSSNNYIALSNNNSTMTSIAPQTSVNSVTNSGSSNANASVRQAQTAPGSRSQSMERKIHESSMSRKSSEYYKVNNHSSLRGSSSSSHHNNIANVAASVTPTSGSLGKTTGNLSASVSNLLGGVSTTSALTTPQPMTRTPSLPAAAAALIMEPQAQVIHLQATKTLPGANNYSNDDDDDIIGEEVRPAPVETDDIRLRILHAVLFDHTYVNPMPLELPTSFTVQLPTVTKSISASSHSTTSLAAGQHQQWSLGGIGAITTAAGSGSVLQQNYALYGSQFSRLHKDNDSFCGINNNSGLILGDIDPGEETETAPEAELEDDSVTRCICDLTHDDGYMICCDKCFAWQHVDCMGIDRQNIPDEYLCEVCQPRIVDKARARSLQLMKRREQQQQLMLTTQAQALASAGTMGAAGSANGGLVTGVANLLANDVLVAQPRLNSSNATSFNLTGNMSADAVGLKLLAAGSSTMKKNKMLKKAKDGVSGKRTKKTEKMSAAAAGGVITNSKPGRKEIKKNTKRKKSGVHEGNISTVGMTAAEKHAANLRQWIENYELAVTNHYSPELRARLHAISKQPSLLQSILNTENPILKDFSNGSLEHHATTVPHAGGKILISNLNIMPNSPICELRGKYMLTTQYKTQNTSMNMNSPPPNNYHLTSYKAHKTPGPFIFFYQLPGTEVAPSSNQLIPQTTTTTILNPDGTYTTTTTTLPAQQNLPTFLKGPEICVDTRTYGNEARFVRRSCRPNAEVQHLFEKGTIHLFIVALTDIRASTEITIRHEPHDLLAIDNKKSTTMIVQPTSTPCACGLTKDCMFGPPIPQLPPKEKSNAGRKSLAHSAGLHNNLGNLTAKQRKASQQNLNRNRSISSSASGDSNMGVNAAANTISQSISLNSPNNVNKIPTTNKIANNNTLMPLTASCNSNLSNASSSSSTLAGVMHDSGVCTSSSSPSVSIPSPTQHMHSPIQQQVHQQQVTHQLIHNNQLRTTVQLLPQQQQQQLMHSLPTPLVLPSYQQQPSHIQQQQPLNVITTESVANLNSDEDSKNETEQKQSEISLGVPENTSQTQSHLSSFTQQIMLNEPSQQVQTKPSQQPITSVSAVSSELLETVSPEATIAAVALQSLNASHSPNTSITVHPPLPESGNSETELQSPKKQQQQFVIIPSTEISTDQLLQTIPHQTSDQSSENKITNTSVTSINSTSPHQSPQQQYKSPLKNNNHSQNSGSQQGRKAAPSKHARATSFSEDNDQQSEDNSFNTTPTSSTPKEKPKLSREDRKMEAILRAIEKMERNQQKQKQTKRQNSSSSHNTTPTSPNKTFESGESSGASKRSNSNAGTSGRSKKKRKVGTKSGQGASGSNNQRKRRQSRINSQESTEECNLQDHEPITSESDSCTVIHSPSLQINALPPSQPQFSTSTTSSTTSSIITTGLTNETTNNVDQAAGLLLAFAHPNISPVKKNNSVEMSEQHIKQSPQRSASQYMMPSCVVAASSPPTPPSQLSSACLLIEAAVGPLESNLDTNNTENHNSEFKYPLQAKTKKHLMNNWLHQAEDITPNKSASSITEQPPPNMQTTTPITSADCSSGVGVAVVSGGLDSLLQAAMTDLTQSQSDQEQPQNLSIAAQKVEEFIQQTEASSACNRQSHPQTKHSFEYEQHQQLPYQRTYANLPTPAVDLTLKTPLTIGPPHVFSLEQTSINRNSPLQISSCSNNSSVKKRWLRQAISEETHEEFQHTVLMPSSPTAGSVLNTFSNSQTLQTTPTFSPAASLSNYVPNGFTTPLKKRRLLLTGKDEVDENISQCVGDLCANSTPSPPATQQQQQQQQQQQHSSEIQQNEQISKISQILEKEKAQDLSTPDMQEDADVDVEKYEIYRTHLDGIQVDDALKTESSQDLQYSKIKRYQDDVHAENVLLLQNDIKMGFKYKNDVAKAEVKKEFLDTPKLQQSDHSHPTEFNDQEDDVDILRSPSPGREMIKAEDNLVKIEPEDTSGMEDVKIDVEREEESMAADDVVVAQSKESKEGEGQTPDTIKQDEQSSLLASANFAEVKKEFKTNDANESVAAELNQILKKDKLENKQNLVKPTEDESNADAQEPKPKRIKLEKEEENILCIKNENEFTKREQIKAEESDKKTDSSVIKNEQLKPNLHSVIREDERVIKTEANKKEKQIVLNNEIVEGHSSVSSTLRAVKMNVANTNTFSNLASATPPHSETAAVSGGAAAPIQRNKSLSDDDIQARLHSFHKENILFLQSRNKKTKSSSSLTSNAATNNCLVNNNEQNKSRTSSSSSSSSYHQQHNPHHHYEGKGKSDKISLKHHKSSCAIQTSGLTKKQKLQKRERTTSSSSSNSHKNSINTQMPSSSSSVSNRNTITSSTSSSASSSSKKSKSLKKSSSGSSTSSNASLSATTLTHQNSIMCSSSRNMVTASLEKEKDTHNRQRIASATSCNNNVSSDNVHGSHTPNYPSSKKRQLNFELELTKDLHLLNSAIASGSKNRKDTTSRLLTDDQSHISAKKSRKDSFIMQKDEMRNSSFKIVKSEKQQDRKASNTNVSNTSTKPIPFNYTLSSQPTITPAINTLTPTISPNTSLEEPKLNSTIVSQSSQPSLAPATVLREHPTLLHLNNIVVANNNSLDNHLQSPSQQPVLIPAQSQPTPLIPSESIPNLRNSPSFIPTNNNNNNMEVQQLSLPPTPPPAAVSAASSPVSTQSVSHLPFFNTIYGKLLNNSTTPPSLPTPLTPSNNTTSTLPSTSIAVPPTGSAVLSEYSDTKLKSYNTLGGYVSHTALFGLSNTSVAKDPNVSSSDGTMSTIASGSLSSHVKESCSEMPAPLAPTANSSSVSYISGNSPATVTPLKIHTKTASHDPRLNPQLTAPEPPPQPKRKLSINEYRKRMQQSSNDSNSGSGSLATTPTTPPTPLESLSLLGPLTITNKCTLYSPDRLTQSVDSQIQKEIMSTTSVVTSSSSSDSLNSSNSSISLNDTLKSSSFVEEDSTKGQFNAAPTLLEKQQESLCARLKSLKEKQSLGTSFSVVSGNRSRFSSFSESVASSDFGLRKDEDGMDSIRNRNLSISSSIGRGDLLDNCLEEISSTSTSMSSSREPSPDRSYTSHHHKIVTASATAAPANTTAISHSNNNNTQTSSTT